MTYIIKSLGAGHGIQWRMAPHQRSQLRQQNGVVLPGKVGQAVIAEVVGAQLRYATDFGKYFPGHIRAR
jgi:hypothetical protein